MGQAKGSDAILIAYEETAYGEDPAAPSGFVLRAHSIGLKGTRGTEDDPTLNPNGEASKPLLGNHDAGGSLPLSLSAEQDGKLLKHTLGGVTVFRPVSVQPVNVTGVVINNAAATCGVGVGTLAFTLIGTLLKWTASGDTAGAGVDVSAGGNFTLPSGTAGNDLYITVTAGGLPGADKSDADIDVVNAYEHKLTFGDLPTGLTFDKDFGNAIAGAGRVEKINGNRISECSIEFNQKGVIVSSYTFKGAKSTFSAAVLDATPDDFGRNAFNAADLKIKIDGAVSTSLKKASLKISNALDEDGYVVGSTSRAALFESERKTDGSINALFDSNFFLDKADTQADTAIDFEVKRGNGFGLVGNEYINFTVQQCSFEKNAPEISGPGGVLIDANFKGYLGANDEPSIVVTVRNQQASL